MEPIEREVSGIMVGDIVYSRIMDLLFHPINSRRAPPKLPKEGETILGGHQRR
jgi:hypothetical protein